MAVKKQPEPAPEPEEEESAAPQPRYVQLDASVIERFLDNVGSVLGGLINASPLPAKAAAKPAEGPAGSGSDDDDDDTAGDRGDDPPAVERKPKPKRNWLLD